MKNLVTSARKRGALALLAFGTMFQFGGCQLDQITTTTTLDGREVLIQLLRGAILNPIDAFITDRVNNLFDND